MDIVLLDRFADVNILLNLGAGTQIPFLPQPASGVGKGTHQCTEPLPVSVACFLLVFDVVSQMFHPPFCPLTRRSPGCTVRLRWEIPTN